MVARRLHTHVSGHPLSHRARLRLVAAATLAPAVALAPFAMTALPAQAAPATTSARAAAAFTCLTVPTRRTDVNASSFLAGVAASSPCNAWAVGGNQDAGFHTLIEHWNGRQWQQVPSPNKSAGPNSHNDLDGVVTTSATNAWAVGTATDSSPQGHTRTLIERWNGHAWTVATSPSPGTGAGNGSQLMAVDALSSTSAWAVGSWTTGQFGTDHSLIEHWNGHQWLQVTSPTPAGAINLALSGVTAISASDVWAVGSYQPTGAGVPFQERTLILHWDGQNWAQVSSPNPAGGARSLNELTAVTATSAGVVWAVGFTSQPGARPATLVARWNGSAWVRVASPNPPGSYQGIQLSSVAAVSAASVWAVGTYGGRNFQAGSQSRTLTEHWDGHSWTRVASPNASAPLSSSGFTSVASLAPGNVIAVGDWDSQRADVPLAAHFGGVAWHLVATPLAIHPG